MPSNRPRSAVWGLVTTLALAGPTAAEQRSFNAIAAETLEAVEQRSSAYQARSADTRKALKARADRITTLKRRLGQASQAARRTELRAQLARAAAAYVKQATELLDGRIAVVARNLVDLDKLAKKARRTGRNAPTEELRAAVERNVAAGRGMRHALRTLAQWSGDNAAVQGSAQRLRRTMHILDRAITADKQQLVSSSASTDRRASQATLERALGTLANEYAALQRERATLTHLKQQVALAVRLGQTELARQAARDALGELSPSGRGTGLPGIDTVSETVNEASQTALDDARQDLAPDEQSSGEPGRPGPNAFDNF